MSKETDRTKLPKTVYVRREEDRGETFLVVKEEIRDHLAVCEERIVGTYKLMDTQEISAEIKAQNLQK